MTRRLKLGAATLAAGVLVTLAVFRGVDLWWWRRQILAAGERRAANLAVIVSEHVQETFNTADTSLRQLAIHSQRVGGPRAGEADWVPILVASKAILTGIGSITITDAGGTIIHSTQKQIIGQSRDTRYIFKRLSTLDRDELVVDTPFLGTSEPRRLLIPIGRRLTTASGTFDGIAVATFNPADLRGFFRIVDVGRDGLVWVFHPSGVVIVCEPSAPDLMGTSAVGNPIFDATGHATAAVVRSRLEPHRPILINAFRTIAVPPLIVAVSLSEPELLEEWTRELVGSIGLLAVLGLTLGAILVTLSRQVAGRAAAENALTRIQQLESIGRLTGGIAHDFNNLLTAILGYTTMVLDEMGPTHPLRRDLLEVQKAGESAAALTRQLLAFSRKQVLQPQIIDLNSAVQRIESMLQRVIGEDVVLVVRLLPSLDPVNADPGQIEQIVMNLAVNARDAMHDGGTLTIETANVELDGGFVAQHPGATAGPHVMLAVSDTGVGMDEPTKAHIFEPFFTTKKRGEGTGLGLATVYGIVKQSGGSIWASSELGRGTTFKVYLPRTTQSPITPVSTSPTSLTGTETILLAEDQPEVRAIARAVLIHHGYTVLEAVDGDQALRIAQEQTTQIHLLFTDVVMPSMSGRELVSRIHALDPSIRALYASGYTDDAIGRHGVLEPGIAFIQKPYTPESLLRKIREVLDAGP